MKQNIAIKKVKKNDLQTILKLQQELSKHHEKMTPTKDFKLYEKKRKNTTRDLKKFILEHLNKKSSLILLAYYQEKSVGFSISFVKETIPIFKIRKYGYISDLYVKRKYRGQKIGKKLINLSINFFKKKKLKFVELAVRSYNQKAIKVYHKAGFKDYNQTMRQRL